MTEYLRAFAERDTDNPDGPIRFVASTEGVKGDGYDLRSDAWDLSRFQRNPVVLWSHDLWGTRPPIGRATVTLQDRKLLADVTFDMADEFAASIARKYREGFLSAVSVSWDAQDNRNHLLEISGVPVPMDPDALMERTRRGLADLGKTLSILDESQEQADTHDAEALWAGTAYQMVRLYRTDANDAESVRLQHYNRLSRLYQRQGKTAPEFLGLVELQALEPDVWRGLFLSGEADAVPELFAIAPAQPVEDWWNERV